MEREKKQSRVCVVYAHAHAPYTYKYIHIFPLFILRNIIPEKMFDFMFAIVYNSYSGNNIIQRLKVK